jgi:DNA-binding GntR family transcriptional regulator
MAEAQSALLARMLRLDTRGDALVGRIARWVALAIIEGRLEAGDDLNSVALAERFETSRTPVREALMLLQAEGLVDIPPRRRPRVAVLDLETIEQVYELRGELLGVVGARVAARAAPDDLAALRVYVGTMERALAAGDADGHFWANVAFGETAAALADDPTLKRTLDSLGLRVLQLRHYSLSLPGRREHSTSDHKRLLRAFEEGDEMLARALYRSIVHSAYKAIAASGWSSESVSRHGASAA